MGMLSCVRCCTPLHCPKFKFNGNAQAVPEQGVGRKSSVCQIMHTDPIAAPFVDEDVFAAQVGGQFLASGMGLEFITFGFDESFHGGGLGLLLCGRLGKDGVHFGFIEPGLQRQQFQLIGMQIADAVGLGREAGQSVETPLFFKDGDALFLFAYVSLLFAYVFFLLADVQREFRDESADPVAHRLRQLIDQRLDFTGKGGDVHGSLYDIK